MLADEARATWLCSWQRSGSTWVAEVLAATPGTRLVYEPANVPDRLFIGEEAARTPLPTGPGPQLDAVERALHGRVRGAWVDQLATGHVVQRRVVKDVRAIGLLDLVAARHPMTPIIVLLRHPLSVATSAVDLGWTPRPELPRDEQLLDEVRRWATMHATALQAPAASRAMVVTYEHLVLAPEPTFHRIVEHLASHHPTWRRVHVDQAQLDTPSATSFRRDGQRSAHEWIGTFSGVSDDVVDATVAILRDAGLDGLYGGRPEPLVAPEDVEAALLVR